MEYFLGEVKANLPNGTQYYCDSYNLEIEIDDYAIQMHKEYQKSNDYIIKCFYNNVQLGFSRINGEEIDFAKECLRKWVNQIILLNRPTPFYSKLINQIKIKYNTMKGLFI